MEASGEAFEGYYVPNRSMLCTAQVIAQITYPEIVEGIRTLAGGGLIMLPASIDDFADPRSRDIIQKTQRSPVATPVERVKLMKLAWDAVGSEFGARHLQYEMFYSGGGLCDARQRVSFLRLERGQERRRGIHGQLRPSRGARA